MPQTPYEDDTVNMSKKSTQNDITSWYYSYNCYYRYQLCPYKIL